MKDTLHQGRPDVTATDGDDNPTEVIPPVGPPVLVGRVNIPHGTATAVADGAIARFRAQASRRRTANQRAADEDKVIELMSLVQAMYEELPGLRDRDQEIVAVTLLGCLDELQEGCQGRFLALSRGEAKMMVLGVAADCGLALTQLTIQRIAHHDADADLIVWVKKDTWRRRWDSVGWGLLAAVVTYAALAIAPNAIGGEPWLPVWSASSLPAPESGRTVT